MPLDDPASEADRGITLFLCGDVMTGRGIDQMLRHPCIPILYEPYVRDARRYVELAEQASGSGAGENTAWALPPNAAPSGFGGPP